MKLRELKEAAVIGIHSDGEKPRAIIPKKAPSPDAQCDQPGCPAKATRQWGDGEGHVWDWCEAHWLANTCQRVEAYGQKCWQQATGFDSDGRGFCRLHVADEEKCPLCDGTGDHNGASWSCPDCNGTGRAF